MPWDSSMLCPLEGSGGWAPLADALSRSLNRILFVKYKPPDPSPDLIPISRPSGTLWSWKKDAVDWLHYKLVEKSYVRGQEWIQMHFVYMRKQKRIRRERITSVSRLDDENEEKLVDGMCKVCGSTAEACKLSATLSLVFIISSPRGHPLGISCSWEGSLVNTHHSHVMLAKMRFCCYYFPPSIVLNEI